MAGGDRVSFFWAGMETEKDMRARAGGHQSFFHSLTPCRSLPLFPSSLLSFPTTIPFRADRQAVDAAPPLSEAYLASGGEQGEERE